MSSAEPTEWEVAWKAAEDLARHVAAGNPLATVPPSVLMRPGEVQYGQTGFDVWMFYGVDIPVYDDGGFWKNLDFGLITAVSEGTWGRMRDAHRQADAIAYGRAQWRHIGTPFIVVTNQRLLFASEGTWFSWEYSMLINIHPEPQGWRLVLEWQQAPPMMLVGPWGPWLSVLLQALHGRR